MTIQPIMPLKIGYVLKRFPNLSQTFILNEILELERQGVCVEIISLRIPRPEPTHASLGKLKAQVTYLEGTDVSVSTLVDKIVAWAKSRQVRHLHAHFATSAAEIAMESAIKANISYSFTAHARDIYHEKVETRALVNRIQKARFVITVSDFNREYLNNLLDKHGASGIVHRLYNGLDLDLFHPAPLSEGTGLVLSIGRLVPKKGMRYLIDACAELRDRNIAFQAVIIGEGEERGSLEQQIKNLSLERHVVLAGAKVQSDVIAALSRSELFVLPCVVGNDGDMDGLPTVILEAMALGIPVVSTCIAGIPEMIQHQRNGLLVGQKDVQGLADAMQALLNTSEKRIEFRKESLNRMDEHFNLPKNVAQLKNWFMEASIKLNHKEHC